MRSSDGGGLRRPAGRHRALIVAALVAAAMPWVQSPARAQATVLVDATEVADEVTALATAQQFGHPVAVGDLRSETNETVANPDGTLTVTASAEPKRVRRGEGFVPVDASLHVNGDGSISPTAVSSDLRLSGGGIGPLLSLTLGGEGLSLAAPWNLPTPSLSGATATYAEVIEGVDLQVTATVEGGYRQVLVVKNAVAAANPALSRIAWGVQGVNTQVRENNGMVEVVDGDGQVLLASDTPTMWDSPQRVTATPMRGESIDGMATAEAEVNGEPHRVESMPLTVADGQIVIEPSAGMLAADDTVYPVFIDPSVTPGSTYGWTVTSSTYHSTAQYNYNGRDYYRAGVEYNTTNKWRTHIGFIVGQIADSTVLSAELDVVAYHTNLCEGSDVQLWAAKYFGNWSSYTWDANGYNDVASVNKLIDTEHFSANKGDCPKADDPGAFTGGLMAHLQGIANSGGNSAFYALKGETESSDADWTKFKPGSTLLQVTYDHTPAQPVGLAFTTTTDCYVQCSSPAIVRTTTPTLRATVQDPNGGVLETAFEVRTAPDLAATIAVTSLEMPRSFQTTVGSATGTAQSMVPSGKLSSGVTYYWHATTKDEEGLWSGWGAWQTVTIDTTAPSVTGVSSSQYPFKVWGAAAGTAGTFTFAASGDVWDYTWSVDGGSTTNTTSTSATYTPTTDMVHTLRVNAKDKAGNSGGNYDHQFWVTPVDTTVRCWYWNLNETSGTSATDTGKAACSPTDNTVVAVNGTLSGSAAFAAGHDGNGVSFTGTGGQVSMSQATVNTSQSFTVTAWVKPSDLSLGDQTVISQDGTNTSRFQLYYDAQANAGAGGWCFGMRATDANAAIAAPVCATGTVPDDLGNTHQAQNNTWVHLAGVYNSAAGTLQIHVMGNPTSCSGEMVQGAFLNSWSTSGPLVVGRAKAGASSAEYFRGVVDEVRAYPKALTTTKICQLAGQ